MSMIGIVYSLSPADVDRLRSEPAFFGELMRFDNAAAVNVSLEKAWHGLHFLLTGDALGRRSGAELHRGGR